MDLRTIGRRKSGRRTSRRTPALSKGDRRRLIQLAVSLAVFGLAFLGRSIDPDGVAYWNDLLRQNTDFKAAFSGFGEAASRGEPLLDSLGELWVEVFAGTPVEEPGTETAPPPARTEVFEDTAPLFQRCSDWEERDWQTIPVPPA